MPRFTDQILDQLELMTWKRADEAERRILMCAVDADLDRALPANPFDGECSTEDALDQACVPFEDVEDRIMAALWAQGDYDSEEPHEPWFLQPFVEEVAIGREVANDNLEMSREGSLVGELYRVRLG